MSARSSHAERRTLRVLLVDDHPIVRQGIATVISDQADMEVCGEAEELYAALRAIEDARPDVAIVDLTLKDSSGLDLIKEIRARAPQVKVLVLSMRDEGFYAERALRAGAMGYLTKQEGAARIVEAVRRVARGEVHLSDKMSGQVIRKYVGASGAGESPLDQLTDRELEIFELIGRGLPTREIGKRLHISTKTVESHREHIKDKLEIDTATDLLKHAIQWVQMYRS